MTAFWIAAGLLTALVLALISRPLLRQRQANHASRKALNTAIYRDQMAELERDLASGALSAADHATARDELERRILEDLADDGAEAVAEPRRLPRTAIALGLALPAAAVLLYLVLGTPAALDPAAVQASNNEQPTQAEVEKMVASLAAKLEKEPDNPKGWVMLGRSYKVMGRLDEAAHAFEKAGPVMETEPELMLEMAELSAARNEGKVEGKGLELLKRVLADQPDNPQALVLAGTDAYFRKNYAEAARYWEKVLTQVPPDSEDARNLSAGIEKVRQLMGDNAGAKPAPRESAQKAVATAGATSVSGRVSLAPALKDKASPDDTLFIFARHANGPRMPLAILRLKAAELPKEFTLDDSMAMSPEMKLSSAAELRIEARISKSGDAIPKSGDLAGELTPIKPGAKGLKLVIDKVVP
ncbi:c-type cytochrome biogenesis protein CcmI [Zoogloea sp.]|uniref:c-type cytochrome biogenesis protein CcmI n=1 Tax=Zoogloea sp. TaxID=49181 RepID=UPI0035B176CA